MMIMIIYLLCFLENHIRIVNHFCVLLLSFCFFIDSISGGKKNTANREIHKKEKKLKKCISKNFFFIFIVNYNI
jgi:hypothetical protein